MPQSAFQKGVLFTITATIMLASLDVSAKYLLESYSLYQTGFLRSLIGFLLISVYVLATKSAPKLKTRKIHLHLIRAVIVTFLLLAVYYAIASIPLVEVEAIGHAAPFFVALFSPLFLGEKVTRHSWIAIAIGFLGILVILRPDPTRFHLAHILMVVAAASYAAMIMIARKLTETDSILALNFYIYPLGAIVLGFLTIGNWTPPALIHWFYFVLMGICGTITIVLFTAAIKYIEATLVATLDYLLLVWVTIPGYLYWGEYPDLITSIGIFLIVCSGIYVVRHSARKTDESIVQTTDH